MIFFNISKVGKKKSQKFTTIKVKYVAKDLEKRKFSSVVLQYQKSYIYIYHSELQGNFSLVIKIDTLEIKDCGLKSSSFPSSPNR